MGIRKFNADYLFTGKEVLQSEAVLLTDDAGVVIGISDKSDAGDDIEVFKGMISPGFINAHCHTELSHMKGKIPPGTGLVEFLTRVIRERNFKKEDITNALLLAEAEMYDNGIVAVGDICNTTDSLQVKKETRLHWHNFIEVIGFNPNDAPARIAYADSLINEFQVHNPLSGTQKSFFYNSSLSPHAPYSVSKHLFELINEASTNKRVTIHNQECDAENELYLHKSGELFSLYKNLNIDPDVFIPTGSRSLQSYLPWLKDAAAVVLVHNVFTNEADLSFLGNSKLPGVYFCICINANNFIQSINPPIELLRKHQSLISLGTDSYASNNQLSILEEMKTIHIEFPGIPLGEILQWATLNGASALGMESKLGSFNVGKQPGVVLISNIEYQHLSAGSSSKRLL
jgi:cytosine/adenosine deaminase-related metal-dependent hydrolase